MAQPSHQTSYTYTPPSSPDQDSLELAASIPLPQETPDSAYLLPQDYNPGGPVWSAPIEELDIGSEGEISVSGNGDADNVVTALADQATVSNASADGIAVDDNDGFNGNMDEYPFSVDYAIGTEASSDLAFDLSRVRDLPTATLDTFLETGRLPGEDVDIWRTDVSSGLGDQSWAQTVIVDPRWMCITSFQQPGSVEEGTVEWPWWVATAEGETVPAPMPEEVLGWWNS